MEKVLNGFIKHLDKNQVLTACDSLLDLMPVQDWKKTVFNLQYLLSINDDFGDLDEKEIRNLKYQLKRMFEFFDQLESNNQLSATIDPKALVIGDLTHLLNHLKF